MEVIPRWGKGRRAVSACTRTSRSAEALAAFDGATEGDLIRELEVAPVRHAARDPGHLDAARAQLTRDEERRRLAVDRRRRRHQDLLHRSLRIEEPRVEDIEGQVLCADALERREQP